LLTAAGQASQKDIMMMPILCAFLAADFVKQLTPKDIQPNALPTLRIAAPAVCAIPLKEIKAVNPNRFDPIALPNKAGGGIDKGIAHPPPIPVCAKN
jgi:hypothetical protein